MSIIIYQKEGLNSGVEPTNQRVWNPNIRCGIHFRVEDECGEDEHAENEINRQYAEFLDTRFQCENDY